ERSSRRMDEPLHSRVRRGRAPDADIDCQEPQRVSRGSPPAGRDSSPQPSGGNRSVTAGCARFPEFYFSDPFTGSPREARRFLLDRHVPATSRLEPSEGLEIVHRVAGRRFVSMPSPHPAPAPRLSRVAEEVHLEAGLVIHRWTLTAPASFR